MADVAFLFKFPLHSQPFVSPPSIIAPLPTIEMFSPSISIPINTKHWADYDFSFLIRTTPSVGSSFSLCLIHLNSVLFTPLERLGVQRNYYCGWHKHWQHDTRNIKIPLNQSSCPIHVTLVVVFFIFFTRGWELNWVKAWKRTPTHDLPNLKIKYCIVSDPEK